MLSEYCDLCMVCQKPAEVFCSCNETLRYCNKDYKSKHKKIEGIHVPTNLAKRRQEINEQYLSSIHKIKEAQKQILTKSKYLIDIVSYITKSKIKVIQNSFQNC